VPIAVVTASSCRFLTGSRKGGEQHFDVKWMCSRRRGVISTL